MSLVAKHYLISGKVQGVGFRRFIQKRARETKVFGWVRNLNDGRVESCAIGNAVAMSDFERFVRRGPLSGKVESCVESDLPEHLASKIKNENDFEVLITGENPCV